MKKCLRQKCGKEFEPAKPKQVYCSTKCRTYAYREKQLEEKMEAEKKQRQNPFTSAARGRDASGVNEDEVKPKTWVGKLQDNVDKGKCANPPTTLDELKALCPHTDKDERRIWVATERQKYGI